MSSISTVEQITNIALDRIGFPESIASIYEGTRQARAALRCYGQTRDVLLRSADWGFPRRDATLTLLKSAPLGGYNPLVPWNPTTNPPLPYAYEYGYPDDCLMVRSLRSPTAFWPVFTPKPVVFEISNDELPIYLLDDNGRRVIETDTGLPIIVGTQQGRVILCYIANAIATYCGQITDPSAWDVGFTEALIDGMVERLAPLLGEIDQSKDEAEKLGMAAATVAAGQALSRVG